MTDSHQVFIARSLDMTSLGVQKLFRHNAQLDIFWCSVTVFRSHVNLWPSFSNIISITRTVTAIQYDVSHKEFLSTYSSLITFRYRHQKKRSLKSWPTRSVVSWAILAYQTDYQRLAFHIPILIPSRMQQWTHWVQFQLHRGLPIKL